jgi:predicted Fe-Mo cluster-binding NifX family protein
MRLCIPTRTDEGLQATSSGHFGSSPWFTVVDTETDEVVTRHNPQEGRRHGTCHPLHELREQSLDAVVCKNIGRGAYSQLRAQGIDVYSTPQATVAEIVAAARSGTLHRVEADEACHGAHARRGDQHRHGQEHGQHRHGQGRCHSTGD